MKYISRRFFSFGAGVFLLGSCAFADLTFTSTGANAGTGNVESAQAVFGLVGDTLTVTLANTDTAADIKKQFQPADVLTAVFFGTSKISATPDTAALPTGSTEVNADGSSYKGTQPLGGEWAYLGGFSGGIANPAGGAKLVNGISSTGLNIFGDGNFGCTPAKKGKNGTPGNCDTLDGIPWGIVAASFPPVQGVNGGITNHPPYENDSVTFTLTVAQGFNLSSVNDLVFLYGTSTGEFTMSGTNSNSSGGSGGSGNATPEPGYLFVLAPGLAVLIYRRIRIQRSSAA